MANSLEELGKLLRLGLRASGQGSYERGMPNREAIPLLIEAQTGLRNYTEQNPNDEAGWRLRTLTEECLTNFAAAILCLEKAMELAGSRTKRDLKQLARLRDHAAQLRENDQTQS